MPRWLRMLLVSAAALGVLVIAGGTLWLRSDDAKRRLHEAVVPRLERRLGKVELGERWRPGFNRWELGPLTVHGPADGDAPLLRAERILITPSWRGLFNDAPIKRVVLEEVDVELGSRAERLNWLQAQLLAERPRGGDGSGRVARSGLPDVHLRGVKLHLGPTLRLGPAGLRVSQTPGTGTLLMRGTWEDATLSASLSKREGEGGWTLEASWEEVPLASIGALLRPGFVSGGRGSGTLQAAGGNVDFTVEARDVVVTWDRLDAAPVGPLTVALEGEATWSPVQRAVDLAGGMLHVGARREVRVPLTAHLPWDPEDAFHVSAQLPPTRLQALAHSLPPVLAPRAELKGVDGPVSASLEIRGTRADRAGWQVEAALDLDGIREVMRGRATRLSETFEYKPLVDDEARGRLIRVGPVNPFFVPGEQVPHLLVRAVLLSEDSFFHVHPGFDIPSLVRNLLQPKEGTLRGGSTLTQQLAKNLYLNREKTYARKLREAFLTVALESSLPKARLLEIYLNVIEWGPDVFGLGEAAWHYFGKDARSLSTKEAIFLATIIPNPIRYHGYCSRGAVSERWEERMGQLFDKMVANGELDPVTAAIARHQPLAFQHRAREDAFFEPLGIDMVEPAGWDEEDGASRPMEAAEGWDPP